MKIKNELTELKARISKGIFLGLAGAVILTGITIGVVGQRESNLRTELATRASMSYYIPVGNGGALAEMSGRVSLDRQEMYGQMRNVYEDMMK